MRPGERTKRNKEKRHPMKSWLRAQAAHETLLKLPSIFQSVPSNPVPSYSNKILKRLNKFFYVNLEFITFSWKRVIVAHNFITSSSKLWH